MCGIFGQINKKYDDFDYREFCTLGIVNDVRGGNSCGVFIDGRYEYGIDKTKHFADFMCSSKLLDKTKKCKIAFGHCRKTSVGTTSLETAQPVVISKDGKPEYVLMHNGTIYNIESLANKYIPDMDIKGMSDSQVMAHIFYNGHYEALKEYNGSAVFAIIDYRESTTNPDILFFQGESKRNEKDAKTEEERPFYFTSHKGTLFFSSIDEILEPIFKDADVYSIQSNKLCEYKDGDLYICEEYDRSECCQNKLTTQICNTSYYDTYYGGYNSYGGYTRNYYDDSRTPWKDDKKDFFVPEPYGEAMPEFSTILGITKLSEWESVDVGSDLLYYQGHKDNLLQGGINISSAGFVSRNESNFSKKYWFWEGILLKNKACFDYLLRVQYEFNIDEVDLVDVFPELVACLSALPFYITGSKVYLDGYKDELYSGLITIPFSRKRFMVKDGKPEEPVHIDTIIYSGITLYEKYKDYDPLTDEVVLKVSN